MAKILQCKGEGCVYPPFQNGWCPVCARTRQPIRAELEIIEWDAVSL